MNIPGAPVKYFRNGPRSVAEDLAEARADASRWFRDWEVTRELNDEPVTEDSDCGNFPTRCYGCKCELVDEVWRVRVRRRRYLTAMCGDCAALRPDSRYRLNRGPCEVCGRIVIDTSARGGFKSHKYCTCSSRCEYAAVAQRYRERRGPVVDRSCAYCGESFSPKRTDAKYCKPAHRQRAYRERVADANASRVAHIEPSPLTQSNRTGAAPDGHRNDESMVDRRAGE